MRVGFGCIWGEEAAFFVWLGDFCFGLVFLKRKHYGKTMAPLVTTFLIPRAKHVLSICRIFIPYSRPEDKLE